MFLFLPGEYLTEGILHPSLAEIVIWTFSSKTCSFLSSHSTSLLLKALYSINLRFLEITLRKNVFYSNNILLTLCIWLRMYYLDPLWNLYCKPKPLSKSNFFRAEVDWPFSCSSTTNSSKSPLWVMIILNCNVHVRYNWIFDIQFMYRFCVKF